jgi:hypothetical protein
LWRLRQVRNERIQLKRANGGSIELFVVVAATSYWVLEKTLAESLKEGYKKSQIHDKLSTMFLNATDTSLCGAEFVARRARRLRDYFSASTKLKTSMDRQPNQLALQAREKPLRHERIPSFGEYLERLMHRE